MNEQVIWLGAITLLAAIVNGALGYGFSSITVPLALLFMSSRVLNPALIAIEVPLNAYVLWVNRDALPAVNEERPQRPGEGSCPEHGDDRREQPRALRNEEQQRRTPQRPRHEVQQHLAAGERGEPRAPERRVKPETQRSVLRHRPCDQHADTDHYRDAANDDALGRDLAVGRMPIGRLGAHRKVSTGSTSVVTHSTRTGPK